MTQSILRYILVYIALLLAPTAWSQTPLRTIWTLETGRVQLADTYLSPNIYTGYHAGIDYDFSRKFHGIHFAANFDYANPPASNASMMGAYVDLDYRLVTTISLPHALRVSYGGLVALHAGGLLSQLSSNNPAQAQARITLAPHIAAEWSYHRWGLGASASVPLIGAFFMPDYGELYYEISLGNRTHLVHMAHPGSFRRLNLDVYTDYRLGGSNRVRLGYRADLLSMSANNIISRRLCNSFYIGLVCDFIPWKGGLK